MLSLLPRKHHERCWRFSPSSPLLQSVVFFSLADSFKSLSSAVAHSTQSRSRGWGSVDAEVDDPVDGSNSDGLRIPGAVVYSSFSVSGSTWGQ